MFMIIALFVIYFILGLYFINYALGFLEIPSFIFHNSWIILVGGIFLLFIMMIYFKKKYPSFKETSDFAKGNDFFIIILFVFTLYFIFYPFGWINLSAFSSVLDSILIFIGGSLSFYSIFILLKLLKEELISAREVYEPPSLNN